MSTILTEQRLKEVLQQIAASEYRPPDEYSPFELARSMLAHIGVTDPELRDDLIYLTFANWITEGVFREPELRQILVSVLDAGSLSYHLGEQGTDSVFRRSFSALLLPLILFRHREAPFLSANEIQEVKRRFLQYYAAEQDLRGYTGEKGWAHTVAHGADVLDELAQCKEMGEVGLREILQAVRAKIAAADGVFCHEEDERLAYAVVSLVQQGVLLEEEICTWVRSFDSLLKRSGGFAESYARSLNAKHFLRSLYFQAGGRDLPVSICSAIRERLDENNRYLER